MGRCADAASLRPVAAPSGQKPHFVRKREVMWQWPASTATKELEQVRFERKDAAVVDEVRRGWRCISTLRRGVLPCFPNDARSGTGNLTEALLATADHTEGGLQPTVPSVGRTGTWKRRPRPSRPARRVAGSQQPHGSSASSDGEVPSLQKSGKRRYEEMSEPSAREVPHRVLSTRPTETLPDSTAEVMSGHSSVFLTQLSRTPSSSSVCSAEFPHESDIFEVEAFDFASGMLHKALLEYDELSLQVEDAAHSVQSPRSSNGGLDYYTSQIAAETFLEMVLEAVTVAPKQIPDKQQLTKAVLAGVWVRVALHTCPRPAGAISLPPQFASMRGPIDWHLRQVETPSHSSCDAESPMAHRYQVYRQRLSAASACDSGASEDLLEQADDPLTVWPECIFCELESLAESSGSAHSPPT